MLAKFTIDGQGFSLPCSIEREATIKSSDVSGYLMDDNYLNDAEATYLTYSVKVAIPITQQAQEEYSTLYEILTAPTPEHYFTFPYNQTTIAFKGRIESVSDSFFRKTNDVNIWRATSFDVVMNEPIKVAGQ